LTLRGNVVSDLSSTQWTVDYYKDIREAQFVLSAGEVGEGGTTTTQQTLTEGNEYDLGNGYKVKVSTINAEVSPCEVTCSTTGQGTECTVSGVENVVATPTTAAVVTPLNPADNPLVITDTEAAGVDKAILVGGPYVNSLVAQISELSDSSFWTPGKAIVKVVGDKVVVAGTSAADTRKAANELIRFLNQHYRQ